MKSEPEGKPEFLQLSDVLYRSIVKRFETLFGRGFASKVLNFSAYTASKETLEGRKKTENLQELLRDTLKTMSGGEVIKCEIERGKRGVVRVKGSLEAKACGPSNISVCYLASGTIRAFAEEITGQTSEMREEKCVAMGDDYCEFIITVK